MRGGIRRRHHEDEEESAFVSMTDMTVSFLFIVMILLAFFASQLQDHDNVPRSELDKVVNERDQLSAEKKEPRWVAYTGEKGWSILFGKNGSYEQDIPREAAEKLGQYARADLRLSCIAFTAKGGWSVIAD